jgi:integrase
MGRTVNQSVLAYWTDARVARYTTPGRLCLGDNLYLNVEPSGSKQYFVRYRRDGKQHDLGLGSTRLITLHEAREAALNCRKLLAKGGDPIAHRREALAAQRVALAKRTIFGECVDSYAAAHQAEWNETYAKRWRATMDSYAIPTLGALPVEAVDKQLVLKVLTPVWEQTPALGIKLRGGIEAVLDHATAHGLRGEADNPARWKDHLEHLLAKPSKIAKVEHQAALPWREIPAFFAALRTKDTVAARALQLILLCVPRKMECSMAQWGEFDLERRLWTIPAERMKMDRNHRVALSTAAVELLAEMRRRCGGHPLPSTPVFRGHGGKPLSHSATWRLVQRMGYGGRMTPHGARSSFIDFARECTTAERDVRELALAHKVGDEVYEAYARSDLFAHRLQLADAWGNFCAGRPIDPAILVGGKLPIVSAAS